MGQSRNLGFQRSRSSSLDAQLLLQGTVPVPVGKEIHQTARLHDLLVLPAVSETSRSLEECGLRSVEDARR